MRVLSRAFLSVAAAAGALVVTAGCNALLGLQAGQEAADAATTGDDGATISSSSTGGASSSSSSSSSAGGGPSCPVDQTCVGNPPPGWTFVELADTPKTCPGVVLSSLPTDDGTCDCICGPPNQDPCELYTLHAGISQCGAYIKQVANAQPGMCNQIGSPISYGTMTLVAGYAEPGVPSAVGCAEETTLPPANGITYDLCPAQVPVGCGDGVCLNTGDPSVQWCIEGANPDDPCPAGFGLRIALYDPASLTDARGCSSCACEPTSDACASGSVALYTDATCTNAPISKFDVGTTCETLTSDPTGATAFVVTEGQPPGCSADGTSTVTGSFMGTLHSTVCCPEPKP